jgi:phospholipid/cholesterol/gamma-HCH transport system substrate-binding protein
MEQRPHYLMVGIFVIVLTFMGIFFILWFSKVDFKGNANLYEIFFAGAVTGLRENEEVKFRGIPIGKVVKISVSKIDPDKVRVLVNINKPELIREDAIATIEAQGLTGYTFVQIKGSTKESPILKVQSCRKYPIIKSKPSEIESLFDEMPRLITNMNAVVKKLSTILDDKTMVNVQQTIDNLAQLSQDLTQGPNSIKLAIEDMRKDFKEIEKAAKDFSQTLHQLDLVIEENRAPIHRFAEQGLPELTRLIQKSQSTMESVKRVAERLEKGTSSLFGSSTKGGYKVE